MGLQLTGCNVLLCGAGPVPGPEALRSSRLLPGLDLMLSCSALPCQNCSLSLPDQGSRLLYAGCIGVPHPSQQVAEEDRPAQSTLSSALGGAGPDLRDLGYLFFSIALSLHGDAIAM